jgi:hypothetical protein
MYGHVAKLTSTRAVCSFSAIDVAELVKIGGRRSVGVSGAERPMAIAALKRRFEPQLKTFHATILVTRAEE